MKFLATVSSLAILATSVANDEGLNEVMSKSSGYFLTLANKSVPEAEGSDEALSTSNSYIVICCGIFSVASTLIILKRGFWLRVVALPP